MATATRTKPNPTHFILIDENYNAVVKRGTEAELNKLAEKLNKGEKKERYFVIGKSWGDPEKNPMRIATRNPSEPTGAATERVVTYYRTPAHKKGREWLERELGQMRLFEYNPAHLSVEKIGAKYGVLLNSQVLRRDVSKPQAGQIVKELKARAANLQKKNPSDTAVAADVADGLIDVFDVSGDGDIDREDIQILDDYDAGEPQLVVDAENEITGEILTETVDGDVVIEWADGKTTVENKDDLAIENGFKSWRLRRKASRQYKRGLKYEEAARKAKNRQTEFEGQLKKNPEPIFELRTSHYGFHIISTNRNLRGQGIALIGDGKNHSRGLKSYQVTDAALDNLEKKFKVVGAPKQNPNLPPNADEIYRKLLAENNLFHILYGQGTTAEKAKATRLWKQALKIAEKYKQNPDLLSVFANLAVGTAAALDVQSRLGKRKTKKRSIVKKPNPSLSQMVATARKNGKLKIAILVANMAKVKEYARTNGGSIRRHGIRYFYHLPKIAKNPSVIKPGAKSKNPAAAVRAKSVSKRAKKANPPKPRLKRNDAYSAFQGRASSKSMNLITPPAAPRRLWTLGKLLEMKISGHSEPFNCRREKSGKTFYLCADEQNKQLWIAGGRIAERDTTLEAGYTEPLGEIVHVVYETEKTHLGDNGVPSAYFHKMGEEGGARPTLELDNQGFAYVIGGDYEITPLGIKN